MSELTKALEKFSFWIENSSSSHAQMIRSYPGMDDEFKREWSPQPGLKREMVELYSVVHKFTFEEKQQIKIQIVL